MRDDVRSTSLSLSLWDVGMRGMGGRQRLIMENGEEREREKGGEIQLAKTDFGCTSGSGTVFKMFFNSKNNYVINLRKYIFFFVLASQSGPKFLE